MIIQRQGGSQEEMFGMIFWTDSLLLGPDIGEVSWTRVKPRKIDIIKTFFRILRDSDSQCSNVASRYCKKSRRNQKSSILLPFWFLVSYLKNILFSVYAKDFL